MSIIKNVTLQKIVAHDFRYDPRTFNTTSKWVTYNKNMENNNKDRNSNRVTLKISEPVTFFQRIYSMKLSADQNV